MLKSTIENTPVKELKGRLVVTRELFRPEKKKKTAEGGFLSGLSDGEQLGVILLLVVLGLLVGPPLLPVVLPASRMWLEAFRTRPTPPGAREYFFPVVILCLFPGLLGTVGLVEAALIFLTGQFSALQKLLDRFIVPDGWQLVYCLIPAYLLLIYYFFRRYRLDQKAIRQFVRAGLEREQVEEAARQAEADEIKRRKEAELKTIHSSGAVLLGEILGRTWEPQTASWTWSEPLGLEGHLCHLTPEHLRRNTQIVAPTRSGKTRNLIEPIVKACLANRWPAIVFDPKGSEFEPSWFDLSFSLQPAEAGSSFRLCLVDPALPPQKALFKLAEALIKENREQPFFSDSSRQALVGIMLGHRTVTGYFPELFEVVRYSQDKKKLAGLLTRLAEIQADNTEEAEKRLTARDTYSLIKVVEQRAANPRSDALGSLYNAILPLATGQYRDYVTCDPRYGLTIRELLEQELVVRLAFTTDEGEIGRSLGKLVVQQFTDAVLSPSASKEKLKLLVIDEAHNYVCESLKVGVAQASGSNAGYVLAFQSLRQIPDEDSRSIIFGNCKNRFVMAGAEYSDAELFSKDFGELELEYHSRSTSQGESRGKSEQNSFTSSRGSNTGRSYGNNPEGSNSGGSRSTSAGLSEGQSSSTSTGESRTKSDQVSYQRRPVWLPGEISRLPRFQAVGITDDGRGISYPVAIDLGAGTKLRQELAGRFFRLEFKPVETAAEGDGGKDKTGKGRSKWFGEEKFVRCPSPSRLIAPESLPAVVAYSPAVTELGKVSAEEDGELDFIQPRSEQLNENEDPEIDLDGEAVTL